MNIDNLPESPASITLSVKSPNGYDVLFTLRNTNLDAMITDLLESEARLSKLGYLPKGSSTYIASTPQNANVGANGGGIMPSKAIVWDDSILCDSCRSFTRIVSGVSKKTNKPYKMRICEKKGKGCDWVSFEN